MLATAGAFLASPSFASPAVTVSVSYENPGQIVDGFGTCLYGQAASQDWFQTLFFDDLRASILRIDLTPHFVSPFSDHGTYSPSPDAPGLEGNVRMYTGASDYGHEFAGSRPKIAVMGPDIERNAALFDFSPPAWRAAGALAQRGLAKSAALGDFKLVGSLWSPAPWLKLASGNRIGEQEAPHHPKIGTPWPFIWAGNYAGGRFDASGTPRPEFDDANLGGTGPTSALVQFARGLAAEVRGFQRTFAVRFYAISLQNELDFETYYNSCSYPQAADYVAALKSVRREFNRYADLRDIRIMGPEDLLGDVYGLWQTGGPSNQTDRNLKYLDAVARDPEAAAGLAFFAIHGYAEDGITSAGSQPDQWLRWLDGWRERPAPGLPDQVEGFRSHGKKSWMTETSGEDPTWLAPSSGFPGQGALGLAIRIHQALVAGQQSAWIYWQLADGKPVSTMTLTDAKLGAKSAKYIAAKHFFAPIRPGARRIEARVSGTRDVLASAYWHEARGSLVLVLINQAAESRDLTFELPALSRGLSSFNVWTSDSRAGWQESLVHAKAGQVALNVPGYGVVSLMGTGEIPKTPILASLPDIPAGQARTAAPTSRPGCARLLRMGQKGQEAVLLAVALLLGIFALRRWRR